MEPFLPLDFLLYSPGVTYDFLSYVAAFVGPCSRMRESFPLFPLAFFFDPDFRFDNPPLCEVLPLGGLGSVFGGGGVWVGGG